MTDSEKVRAIRSFFDLSMEQFGTKLGISGSAISLMESGKNNVSPRIKINIVSVFNVNPEYFSKDDAPMFAPNSRREEIAAFMGRLTTGPEDFKTRLISVLANLNESQWELLADMADKLVAEKKEDRE